MCKVLFTWNPTLDCRPKRKILRKRKTKSKASFMLTIETDEAVCEVSWDTLQNKGNHDDSCLLWIDVYWSIVLNWGTVWCSFEVGHDTLHKLLTATSRNGEGKRMLVSSVWWICEKTASIHLQGKYFTPTLMVLWKRSIILKMNLCFPASFDVWRLWTKEICIAFWSSDHALLIFKECKVT
jgi:hypothetical protein